VRAGRWYLVWESAEKMHLPQGALSGLASKRARKLLDAAGASSSGGGWRWLGEAAHALAVHGAPPASPHGGLYKDLAVEIPGRSAEDETIAGPGQHETLVAALREVPIAPVPRRRRPSSGRRTTPTWRHVPGGRGLGAR